MTLNKKLEIGNVTQLQPCELEEITGGWDYVGGGPSVLLYYIYQFGKAAAEYQASLPPNLKK